MSYLHPGLSLANHFLLKTMKVTGKTTTTCNKTHIISFPPNYSGQKITKDEITS
jgi:hypothetical protein